MVGMLPTCIPYLTENLKGISHTLPLFLPQTKPSLGCGNKIPVLTWSWVDLQPLFSRFPRLFNLSSLKTGVFSCFLALSFCRNLRDPEVVELSSLLVLHNSHLSPSCLDSRLRSLSSSGIFSVSSFFFFSFSSPSSVSFPTKRFGFPLSLLKSKLFFGAWSRAWKRLTSFLFGGCYLHARFVEAMGFFFFFFSMLLYGPFGRNGIGGFLRTLQGTFFEFGSHFISCSELV